MLTFLLTFVIDPQHEDRFEQIYYAHREKMMNIAESILHNYHDAEDAVQNAFIAIAKHMDTLENMSEPAICVYVCKSAKNAALNPLPAKRKRDQVVNLEQANPAVFDDAIAKFVLSEKYQTVVVAIHGIPEPYRDVLSLYYIYDLKPSKIAAILGRNTDTVKSQLKRGKACLLSSLEDQTKE